MNKHKGMVSIGILPFLVFIAAIIPSSPAAQIIRHPRTGEGLKLFPNTYDQVPDLPSPCTWDDGTDVVVAFTLDQKYILFPVTIENGKPQDYQNRQWYHKGRQLEVDAVDFPTLGKTGVHSESELNKTGMITGRSIDEITENGRPEGSSGAGFMDQDEDIISVLKGDNRLVAQLGVTHRQMAEPLFHVFNLIITLKKDSERGNIGGVLYNSRKIYLKFWGAKGWQNSIFNDEILGYWEIEIWRDLDPEEKAFLARRYSHLTDEEQSCLIAKLSHLHTGEMVPFYIMRYGFYEGHTDYRADPVSLSFIFGFKSVEEIESAFPGKIYEVLLNHHKASPFRISPLRFCI
jgi:hypothetical protein